MKIHQTLRHFAAKTALETPLVRDKVKAKLTELHTRVFLERAEPEDREARRAHLDAFFEASIDVYLQALREGYTEAGAREITHILANAHFANQGWVEMMEIPPDEVPGHLDRYAVFLGSYGLTADKPLGDFTPEGGLPPAPSTPEKLEEGQADHAEPGYGDDLYVEDREGELRKGQAREDA